MIDYDKKYFLKDNKAYVVRFFDCQSSRDLQDLLLIVESPEVQRWMDNVNDLSFGNYTKWMDEKGENNTFLFAIADPRDIELGESRVHGFVYFYPSRNQLGSMEISYAKRPGAPAGLIAPGLKAAIEFVADFLKENNPLMLNESKLVAEIEEGNVASIKVAEKAGFKKISDFDNSNNAWWVRSFEFGPSEVGAELNETERKFVFEKLKRIRQENGTYCAPAVVQILLSHFGIDAIQDNIANAGCSKEYASIYGMSLEQIATAIGRLYPQMSLWVKREASLFDLEKMVREFNYPVVVDWQGYFDLSNTEEGYEDIAVVEEDPMLKGDNGHYSVVIDLDRANNNIRLIDPYGHYSEKDRFFEIQDFLSRWWDDRMDKNPDGSKKYVYENRLMFVIVPKEVRVPEVLGMVEM